MRGDRSISFEERSGWCLLARSATATILSRTHHDHRSGRARRRHAVILAPATLRRPALGPADSSRAHRAGRHLALGGTLRWTAPRAGRERGPRRPRGGSSPPSPDRLELLTGASSRYDYRGGCAQRPSARTRQPERGRHDAHRQVPPPPRPVGRDGLGSDSPRPGTGRRRPHPGASAAAPCASARAPCSWCNGSTATSTALTPRLLRWSMTGTGSATSAPCCSPKPRTATPATTSTSPKR